MSTNAISIRISLESSFGSFFGGVGELILQISGGGTPRYGIRAAGMKWMTTSQTFQAQPGSPDCSMDFDGLTCVFRACGIKAAGRREQRRNQELVTAEEEDEDGGRDSLHLIKKRLISF